VPGGQPPAGPPFFFFPGPPGSWRACSVPAGSSRLLRLSQFISWESSRVFFCARPLRAFFQRVPAKVAGTPSPGKQLHSFLALLVALRDSFSNGPFRCFFFHVYAPAIFTGHPGRPFSRFPQYPAPHFPLIWASLTSPPPACLPPSHKTLAPSPRSFPRDFLLVGALPAGAFFGMIVW